MSEQAVSQDYARARDQRADAAKPANGAAAEKTGMERRRGTRSPVIKSARLVFDHNLVFNCLVLDESAGGVLVDMGAMIKVPDEMTIQFAGGASYVAERRWTVGTKSGLKFLGGQMVDPQTAGRMRLLAGILQNQGVPATLQTLRTARYFDNVKLREAADSLEAAYHEFAEVLGDRGAV